MFPHIYRSSRIWPGLEFNLNCPQAAATEPWWHFQGVVPECWNEPGKNNKQEKSLFGCELSLKILMCYNLSAEGWHLLKECVISCNHLLKVFLIGTLKQSKKRRVSGEPTTVPCWDRALEVESLLCDWIHDMYKGSRKFYVPHSQAPGFWFQVFTLIWDTLEGRSCYGCMEVAVQSGLTVGSKSGSLIIQNNFTSWSFFCSLLKSTEHWHHKISPDTQASSVISDIISYGRIFVWVFRPSLAEVKTMSNLGAWVLKELIGGLLAWA